MKEAQCLLACWLRPRERYQEPCMGTWGTGPFDSDLAADFVDELEGLTSQKVIEVLERAFQRVTDSGACWMAATAPKRWPPRLSLPAQSRAAGL
ncbi:DUF4259 domain-containing protein [Streptomyces sp. NPDC001815]|uniref:DUF4259 domain-containing protein n=1 Tax=Streptomyces sp. NPDC001815 TaxID=3154526 RepID=UPI003326A705